MSKLSLYADSLPPDAKVLYLDKIESIGGSDPFSSDFVGEKSNIVPLVSGCNLVSYLVLPEIIYKGIGSTSHALYLCAGHPR